MKRAKNERVVKSERLTITLGVDQRRQIAALARNQRTSEAAVIRWALDEYIAQSSAKTSPGRRQTNRANSR